MPETCVNANDDATATAAVARYTPYHVQGILQFMGCKTLHAVRLTGTARRLGRSRLAPSPLTRSLGPILARGSARPRLDAVFAEYSPIEGTARVLSLQEFEATLCEVTSTLQYAAPSFLSDFEIARQVKDQERPLCILLGGTSGCGKSTLGSLLASRLGVTTVLSTDHIRHLLRSVVPRATNPVLWASSYHAGDALPDAAAEGLTPTERVRTTGSCGT